MCRRCGCEFQVRQSEVDRGHGIYCSEACRRSYEFENAKNYPKIGRKAIHRTVASESIGRPLKAGEIVHHKDENKLNCDPGNLEVLASQAEHMALHAKRGEESAFAKLDWAKVGEIRRRSAEGETPAVLADEFHVDPSNIRLIVKRKTWK